MGSETIQFVKDAEEKAAQLRVEGQLKKEAILASVNQEIEEKEKIAKQTLAIYKEEQVRKKNTQLSADKERLTKEFTKKITALNQQVAQKKEKVVEDIIREVIHQYGHR